MKKNFLTLLAAVVLTSATFIACNDEGENHSKTSKSQDLVCGVQCSVCAVHAVKCLVSSCLSLI